MDPRGEVISIEGVKPEEIAGLDLGHGESWTSVAAGVQRCEDITISGHWDTNDDAIYTLTIQPGTLPRRAKRLLTKLIQGRPLSRREQERGATFWHQGQRITITPTR